MVDMSLTRNFSLWELTFTTHRKYLEENRNPPDNVLLNLQKLCANILQPIRDYYRQPLIIHSGYRCPKLNRAIGSKDTSQHLKGEAVDFRMVGIKLEKIFNDITTNQILIDWGQIILEGYSANRPSWIHISLPTNALKRQVLRYDGKRYIRSA